mmetsp:Transcript_3753/g.10936  ORF Transcript_3753/g.10936 Transcript_3753/m.10936 type:complete len:220 (+) Transcript_3753:1514-2173(+)
MTASTAGSKRGCLSTRTRNPLRSGSLTWRRKSMRSSSCSTPDLGLKRLATVVPSRYGLLPSWGRLSTLSSPQGLKALWDTRFGANVLDGDSFSDFSSSSSSPAASSPQFSATPATLSGSLMACRQLSRLISCSMRLSSSAARSWRSAKSRRRLRACCQASSGSHSGRWGSSSSSSPSEWERPAPSGCSAPAPSPAGIALEARERGRAVLCTQGPSPRPA